MKKRRKEKKLKSLAELTAGHPASVVDAKRWRVVMILSFVVIVPAAGLLAARASPMVSWLAMLGSVLGLWVLVRRIQIGTIWCRGSRSVRTKNPFDFWVVVGLSLIHI